MDKENIINFFLFLIHSFSLSNSSLSIFLYVINFFSFFTPSFLLSSFLLLWLLLLKDDGYYLLDGYYYSKAETHFTSSVCFKTRFMNTTYFLIQIYAKQQNTPCSCIKTWLSKEAESGTDQIFVLLMCVLFGAAVPVSTVEVYLYSSLIQEL